MPERLSKIRIIINYGFCLLTGMLPVRSDSEFPTYDSIGQLLNPANRRVWELCHPNVHSALASARNRSIRALPSACSPSTSTATSVPVLRAAQHTETVKKGPLPPSPVIPT